MKILIAIIFFTFASNSLFLHEKPLVSKYLLNSSSASYSDHPPVDLDKIFSDEKLFAKQEEFSYGHFIKNYLVENKEKIIKKYSSDFYEKLDQEKIVNLGLVVMRKLPLEKRHEIVKKKWIYSYFTKLTSTVLEYINKKKND